MIRRRVESNPNQTPDQRTRQFTKLMKRSKSKPMATALTPVFPPTVHSLRSNLKSAGSSKLPKRDNTFSKSRDTREDRGTRQMKTSHNAQSFPHVR
jgi:hypothetical protein